MSNSWRRIKCSHREMGSQLAGLNAIRPPRLSFLIAFLGRLCYARSAAKLLRINLENWIENSRGAGAVCIKSPSLVAYLYPESFKCEEMRDECRPFPSNSNAMAVEHRGGCVPPPSRSDGNPRRKKKRKEKEKHAWKRMRRRWKSPAKIQRTFA